MEVTRWQSTALSKEKGWGSPRWCFSQEGTHEKAEGQQLTCRSPSGTGNRWRKLLVTSTYLTLASRVWKLSPYTGCSPACVEWLQCSPSSPLKRGESFAGATWTPGWWSQGRWAGSLPHGAGPSGIRGSAKTASPSPLESSSCCFLTRIAKYPRVSAGHLDLLVHILKEPFSMAGIISK